MHGKELRKRLKTLVLPNGETVKIKDIAAGLGMREPAFQSKMRAKSIDYDMLKKISEILKISIEELTGEYTTLSEPDTPYTKMPNTITLTKQEFEALHNELKDCYKMIIELQKTVITTQNEHTKAMQELNEIRGRLNRKV